MKKKETKRPLVFSAWNIFTIVMLLFITCVAIVTINTAAAQDVSADHEGEDQTAPTISLLIVGGNAGAMFRNDAGGGFISLDLALDTDEDWVYGGVRILGAAGLEYRTSDSDFVGEISGYGHLLAIGIADITYRHYLDGHELRVLAGFSYSRHVEDIVRVDINLGGAYFDEIRGDLVTTQFGMQVSARVTADFWRIHNVLSGSVFQNVRLNDAGLDLSDLEIVCDNFDEVLTGADLRCVFEEPSEASSEGGGILTWLHTGVILHNRTFLWLIEDPADNYRVGVELELRYEHLPLRNDQFWVLGSLRGQFALN